MHSLVKEHVYKHNHTFDVPVPLEVLTNKDRRLTPVVWNGRVCVTWYLGKGGDRLGWQCFLSYFLQMTHMWITFLTYWHPLTNQYSDLSSVYFLNSIMHNAEMGINNNQSCEVVVLVQQYWALGCLREARI